MNEDGAGGLSLHCRNSCLILGCCFKFAFRHVLLRKPVEDRPGRVSWDRLTGFDRTANVSAGNDKSIAQLRQRIFADARDMKREADKVIVGLLLGKQGTLIAPDESS